MNWNIIHLLQTTSTNDYIKENINAISTPAIIYANYQTKGRGQQNTSWYSEPNKNLLCSILLDIYLPTEDNNYISRWISIILVNLLKQLSIHSFNIKIKWPNDIIIYSPENGYKKIAGILIENSIEKKLITKTIIGIGLNVNQTNFQQLNKTATSIKLVTQQTYSIENIVKMLIDTIEQFYPLIQFQKKERINELYIQYLYGWETEFFFKKDNHILKGKIKQLLDDGRIIVAADKRDIILNKKEIEFLL